MNTCMWNYVQDRNSEMQGIEFDGAGSATAVMIE